MSKLVDNLLGKLDQLKRKVMTDTESNIEKENSSTSPETKEGISGLREETPAAALGKKSRKTGRPRRKTTRAKTKAAAAGPEETARKPQQQPKKAAKDAKKLKSQKRGRL
ncbi:MAG: hypothetical protein ACWGN1_02550 [Desulfobulbales bacterium]